EIIRGFLRRGRNIAEGMDTDREVIARMSGAFSCFPIQIDERTEAPRLTADDRDHKRQPQRPRSHERFRRSADTEPDRKRILHGPWVDPLTGQRWTVLTRPVHMLVLAD